MGNIITLFVNVLGGIFGGTSVIPILQTNCGGIGYTDSQGEAWQRDAFFIGFSQVSSTSEEFTNTEDPFLYQSARQQTDTTTPLVYEVPIVNGGYRVDLHFAETMESNITVGDRIFDVTIEGNLVLDNYDILARTVQPNVVIIERIQNVIVLDGGLTISIFASEGVGKLNAFGIYQAVLGG